ncbi:uncharacterized protein LOC108734099 [Agrilus planipennis]|uniref:Uncharacterized protein LOC108734099 n=1 Tax=Agrilus planipennis TaxID=224129 RepID=A0A1W4WAI1_AGRPL|nr:uncharacterized protein LOC108734099 [Agrilus planipennis]
MFTLPPWPPKDYILKDISQNYTSNQEFSPSEPPRHTQPNVGKYIFPIQYGPEDAGPSTLYSKPGETVLNKWLKDAKAIWVDKPGENADFVHDIARKYSVVVTDTYNPTYKPIPKLIPRSYKFEIDYMINTRLDKLKEKMEQEAKEEELWVKQKQAEKIAKATQLYRCDLEPPGWWKEEKDKPKDTVIPMVKPETETSRNVDNDQPIRWQNMPRVFDKTDRTACKRKSDMALVGQPFKHEACNWYFINYPPPNVPFRPERFSK